MDPPFPISKIKLSQLARVGILNLPSLYGCGVCGGGALAPVLWRPVLLKACRWQ